MLVIHPASAGHGLNLQFGGKRIAWLTPTFNLEHWLQTISRLRRTDGAPFIHVHRFIIEGTRDSKVVKVVTKKENVQNFLMREIKELRQKYAKR